MNVYFIYRILTSEGTPLDSPLLYAITDDKSMLKGFKKQRKMELFSVQTKEVSEKDYQLFEQEHIRYRLINCNFKHKKNDSSQYYVPIVAPRGEEYEVIIQGPVFLQKLLYPMERRVYHLMNDSIKDNMNSLGVFANSRLDEFAVYSFLHGDTLNEQASLEVHSYPSRYTMSKKGE